MSGIWLYIFFIIFVSLVGYVNAILLLIIAFYIIQKKLRHVYPTIGEEDFFRNVQEGDIILVCRGGQSGVALDIVEFYVYNIVGTLFSQSILGHVAQVFKDSDGSLKVMDVRLNTKSADRNSHFICTVEEFMSEYEGVKFWKQSKAPLTSEESFRLTKAARTLGSQTGHCDDCFNPMRMVSTPSNNASPKEILEFGKEFGFGCAENVSFIRRAAGLDAPTQRFVLPHHFSDETIVRIV